MATYIAAIPLLPGIGFVDMLFGGWPSIHQGQIALIPVVSAPADIAIIFAIWTLVDRRNSPAAEKDVALRLRH